MIISELEGVRHVTYAGDKKLILPTRFKNILAILLQIGTGEGTKQI